MIDKGAINSQMQSPTGEAGNSVLDHSSDERFYQYYANQSESERTWQRRRHLRDSLLRVLSTRGKKDCTLEVADIGCGAGTQSFVWAEAGHRVRALDVNEPLLMLARERAAKVGADIEFHVGSATALPWPDKCVDVCIALELLEHVADWQSCLREFVRILRPEGALYFTTTNRLCPVQEEFKLPLYSWYPAALKRYFERLAQRRPSIANYARYPAVNWFTVHQLRKVLAGYGCACMDRFDLMDVSQKGRFARYLVAAIRVLPPLRWLGLICTPGTRILALKPPTAR